MAFDDFVKNFTNVDISHFVNTNVFAIKKAWHESIFYSEWSIGRSGGSEINSSTFLSNPQNPISSDLNCLQHI
ncbi:hypothetical protein CHS0354_003462 [Potamilus streckersoni]|uniref:Uncharacterized protein n=1 Tax=Potamilus streckersoni TaxID=2493646 RepID=A0AAE0SPM2_9BIVA|nr:hypothetical protein CHS0354_003462 [Potamilus streckersoni]